MDCWNTFLYSQRRQQIVFPKNLVWSKISRVSVRKPFSVRNTAEDTLIWQSKRVNTRDVHFCYFMLFNLLSKQTGPLRFIFWYVIDPLSLETAEFKDGLFISFPFGEVNMTFVRLGRGTLRPKHSSTSSSHSYAAALSRSLFWLRKETSVFFCLAGITHRHTGRKVREWQQGKRGEERVREGAERDNWILWEGVKSISGTISQLGTQFKIVHSKLMEKKRRTVLSTCITIFLQSSPNWSFLMLWWFCTALPPYQSSYLTLLLWILHWWQSHFFWKSCFLYLFN